MDEKIPEPLSKSVEPTKPGANIPPAPAAPNATVSSTPMGMPASNVGKSGGGKKVLVVLLVLILMASTAAFGYLWWQARSAQAQVAQAQTDKEAAEKKATEAEAKLKELEDTQATETEAAKQTDTELITAAAQNYANAMVDGANDKLGKPELNAKNKSFATVAVSGEGGYVMTLKKVNNAWVVIYSGQAAPDAATVEMFGIPQ